ncbi:hypothetical protein [Sphingopyxis sp. LC363]|uniref:hypothetical protein n=1 Tax=Sphingopyxis sp. LC363 TaxID=1120705 RepID=UPI00050E73C7|nr:hypothetical protein [Sphingopyxis sp. LC363]KGB53826.1 hypothetical protein FG95_03242 [Sphingopyxis sp. LC363]
MPFFELLNGLAPPAERMRWEASLVRHARDYARNDDLVREGAVPEKLHVVLAGWAQRYKQLEDGRREISARKDATWDISIMDCPQLTPDRSGCSTGV